MSPCQRPPFHCDQWRLVMIPVGVLHQGFILLYHYQCFILICRPPEDDTRISVPEGISPDSSHDEVLQGKWLHAWCHLQAQHQLWEHVWGDPCGAEELPPGQRSPLWAGRDHQAWLQVQLPGPGYQVGDGGLWRQSSEDRPVSERVEGCDGRVMDRTDRKSWGLWR